MSALDLSSELTVLVPTTGGDQRADTMSMQEWGDRKVIRWVKIVLRKESLVDWLVRADRL